MTTGLFESCLALSSICIPSCVETLGERCLFHCEKLSAVTFEARSKLNLIEFRAFAYDTSLAAISIPPSVTRIREHVFLGCAMLSSVTFESGSRLDQLGPSAFNGCRLLAAIYIPPDTDIARAVSDFGSLVKVVDADPPGKSPVEMDSGSRGQPRPEAK
jgi:hypothetical protein